MRSCQSQRYDQAVDHFICVAVISRQAMIMKTIMTH
jgi:hypothetical protein